MELEYKEHPTKEDLLAYFENRISIRKITEREALRLMDVDDADIDKILNAEEIVVSKNGKTKINKVIPKTSAYKLAGNSIVVSCLYYIFKELLTTDGEFDYEQIYQMA